MIHPRVALIDLATGEVICSGNLPLVAEPGQKVLPVTKAPTIRNDPYLPGQVHRLVPGQPVRAGVPSDLPTRDGRLELVPFGGEE